MRRDPGALAAALADLDARQLRRVRRVAAPRSARGAPQALEFCSNDYLGLARHPGLVSAFVAAAERHGVGSGASHLVTGHSAEHAALEEEVAAFTGRERALCFSTGYMANLGVIDALLERRDLLLEDRLNHASLLDAGRLARATLRRYPHNDSAAAAGALQASVAANALIATDGVFSMDGDLAPLPQLAAAASQYRTWLLVDDAHGLGVLGRTGRGVCEHYQLDAQAVPILIGTFGKAFGTCGAFVAGSADLIEFLLQKSRTYIYTTALPPAVAAATRAALAIAQRESWRRETVLALVQRFRRTAVARGIPLTSSSTPIQPVILGSAARALAVSRGLETRGLLVSAIRPPSVPAGSARLRITFSASHTEQDVDRLVAALADVLEETAAR
ncbi:MAG TPA: 8-amino-7-oxononanoate synthase [Steroidobacteraceae bacterium]|nr:8-amino-7-oxononanoate synthase [Steroidobacteraceae bacterium]HRX88370.1 8-amino-7-oxononanoate synthase [Steroidobacteraceae bacterium]